MSSFRRMMPDKLKLLLGTAVVALGLLVYYLFFRRRFVVAIDER